MIQEVQTAPMQAEMEADAMQHFNESFVLEQDLTVEVDMMTQEMQDAFDKTMAQLDELMEGLGAEDAPVISIDGVGITSTVSPVSSAAQTAATTVNIVTNSSDDAVTEHIIRTVDGNPPLILSQMKFPDIDQTVMLEAIDLNQIERQLIKETIVDGLEVIASTDPEGLYTSLVEENESEKERIAALISALSELQTQANVAASGLDINSMSEQIMSLSNDKLAEIIQTSETGNDALASTITAFIEPTLEDNHLETHAYTSSAKIILIAQNLFNAAIKCYPTVLSQCHRAAYAGGIHQSPGPAKYGAYQVTDGSTIPSCHNIFRKNPYSIISTFDKLHFSDGVTGSPSAGDVKFPSSNTANHHLIGYASDNPTEKWDYINHLICTISNELIISAGIGRLKGSSLGERFLISEQEYSAAEMPTQTFSLVHPFHKVFGNDISQKLQTKIYVNGGVYAGGLIDYLALGEESDNPKFVVMPFEVNTAREGVDGPVLVGGKKYFVDMAIQSVGPTQPDRSALKNFSNQFSLYTADMSAYVTEILALDQETSLAPELIMARVLQDFKSVLTNGLLPAASRDILSDVVAGMFQRSAEEGVPSEIKHSANTCTHKDLVRGAVVKSLNSLDSYLEDSTFKLSTAKTTYDVASNYTDENPPPEGTVWFESRLREAISEYTGGNAGLNGTSHENVNYLDDPTSLIDDFYGEQYSELNVGSIESFDLHDASWQTSSNLLNLMSKTIRELQAEANNLATREGATSSYKTDVGETHLSGADEDIFITTMVDLYCKIAALVLPCGSWAFEPASEDIRDEYSSGGRVVSVWSATATNASLVMMTKVIDSLVNGAPINDEIYTSTGIEGMTDINQHQHSWNGFSNIHTFEATAQDLVEASARISKHRYNLKASLKVLETIATSAEESSASLTEIFNILDGNVENLEDLTETQVILHDLFTADNASSNISPVRTISEYQNNLNCAAYQTILQKSDDNPLFFRSETFLSKSERYALDQLVSGYYDPELGVGMDQLHILSVGLPIGLIEATTRPAYSINDHGEGPGVSMTDLEFNQLSSASSSESSLLEMKVSRYEEVYFRASASPMEEVKVAASDIILDPELFILPSSIQYNPHIVQEDGSVHELGYSGVLKTTIFYRIRGGTIIEEITGVDSGVDRNTMLSCHNCLLSYLLDLWMYETSKMRYNDSACLVGAPELTPASYNFLSHISNNTQMSQAIASRTGFIDLYDKNTLKLHEEQTLRQKMISTIEGVSPTHGISDLHTAGYLSLVPMLTNNQKIVATRPFERIYNIIYDESSMRSSLEFAEQYAEEGSVHRGMYDAFSLRVSIDRVTT